MTDRFRIPQRVNEFSLPTDTVLHGSGVRWTLDAQEVEKTKSINQYRPNFARDSSEYNGRWVDFAINSQNRYLFIIAYTTPIRRNLSVRLRLRLTARN